MRMIELREGILHVEDVPVLQLSAKPSEDTVRGEVRVASYQIVDGHLIEAAPYNKKGQIPEYLQN